MGDKCVPKNIYTYRTIKPIPDREFITEEDDVQWPPQPLDESGKQTPVNLLSQEGERSILNLS